MPKLTKHIGLWQYNSASGLWKLVQTCRPETAQAYLDLFKKDEPGEHFKLLGRKPKEKPDAA